MLALATLLIWRKMEGKAPIRITKKAAAVAALTAAGSLVFGAGICLCLVWDKLLVGIPVGLAGILLLFLLIPMTKGLK